MNKEEKKRKNKEWYESHKDYVREYQRRWRKENPDKVKAYRSKSRGYMRTYTKEYYQQNREKIREKSRKYYHNNKALFALYARTRYAQTHEKFVIVVISPEGKEKVFPTMTAAAVYMGYTPQYISQSIKQNKTILGYRIEKRTA